MGGGNPLDRSRERRGHLIHRPRSPWPWGGRDIPHRNQGDDDLVASAQARLRPRNHAFLLATWQCDYAATRRLYDDCLRLAYAILPARRNQPGVGGLVDYILPGQSA